MDVSEFLMLVNDQDGIFIHEWKQVFQMLMGCHQHVVGA